MNVSFHEQRLAPPQSRPHEQRVRRFGAERLTHERRAFAERPEAASRAVALPAIAGEAAHNSAHGSSIGRTHRTAGIRHVQSGGASRVIGHAAPRQAHAGRSPLAHLSRATIHASHLERVEWQREEQEYRTEVRHWRQALRQRERLLRKLLSLERRLEKLASRRGTNG
ncbi:MAG: hypothetical protein JO247_09000 [Chloroflexi bacterium]|nr:hypothetical protein [Chloroflexota bacterium]